MAEYHNPKNGPDNEPPAWMFFALWPVAIVWAVTVDSDGNLHNCCVKAHDANKRGSLFDTDLEEFNRYRMEKDADCKKCKAHGHHVYAMQQYRVPVGWLTTAKQFGATKWRELRLNTLFPSVSNWRSKGTYVRPRKSL